MASAGGKNSVAGPVNVAGPALGQNWPGSTARRVTPASTSSAYLRKAWFVHLIRMMRGMVRGGRETWLSGVSRDQGEH